LSKPRIARAGDSSIKHIEEEAAELLAETLEEEEDADEKLTNLAQSINVEAKA
jgi:ferritin-like metal-binding protein YciE